MLAESVNCHTRVASEPPAPGAAGHLRVLHLHAGNMYGGVETLLMAQARFRHLSPALELHFGLCFEGRLSRELSSTGAPVHLLGQARISRPWSSWRARIRLKELLRGEHFDAVICHMPWPLAVFGPTVRAAGPKLIFWAHSDHSGKGWLERMARRSVPDMAISTSRYVGAFVANLYHDVPTEVLHAPLPLIDSPDRAEWREDARREFGIGQKDVVIAQVSRFESWKGHLLHLEALSQLVANRAWTCWFVGGPQGAGESAYFKQVKAAVKRLGLAERVRFLGQRADVPRLLAGADIFCQPNQGPEPFGIVFVEALWAGRPVVTTALGGGLEIIDPSCGILTEPGNAASLATALERLIESAEMRAQLGKAGPARAKQLCDPASQMHVLEELIRKATRGGKQ